MTLILYLTIAIHSCIYFSFALSLIDLKSVSSKADWYAQTWNIKNKGRKYSDLRHSGFLTNTKRANYKTEPSKEKSYEPIWESLDSRPLPEWYDRAKVGIFLHWGVYSVPSFGSSYRTSSAEWFWFYSKGLQKSTDAANFMKMSYPPGFQYQDFAPMFKAEFFNPHAWATLFEKSGAKYVVLTSKHHDGYSLYLPKRFSKWNSVNVGPRRDLVGMLSRAIRDKGMKFGVYHSLMEWFNPLYDKDRKNHWTTQQYTISNLLPDLQQLIQDYKPSVLWVDGDWENTEEYFKSKKIIAWLYNKSLVKDEIVVNDRWGKGTRCKHGDFHVCNDRYNPGTLQSHKWENAFTIDKGSWGYRRNIDIYEIHTIDYILKELVSTVSCGGNVLINVGPTKEGTIPLIFQERLLALGDWLLINGEGIYNTSPWFHQRDCLNSNVWYTCTKNKYNSTHPTAKPSNHDKIMAIYVIFLKWPKNSVLILKDLAVLLQSGNWQIKILENQGSFLKWKVSNKIVNIKLPNKATVNSLYAWTLKLTNKL